MDRRTLLAVVLSLGIYVAWMAWRGPQLKPGADGEPGGEDVVDVAPAPSLPVPVPTEDVTGPSEKVPVLLCDQQMLVDTDGGALSATQMHDVLGPYHVTPIYSWVLGLVTGSSEIPWLPYGPPPGPAFLLSEKGRGIEVAVDGRHARFGAPVVSPGRVVLEGSAAQGLRVRHEIAEVRAGDVCTLDVSTTFSNPGDAPVEAAATWRVGDHTNVQSNRSESQRQPTALVDGDLYYGGALGAGCVRAGTQLEDDLPPIELAGPVSWFGTSDRYFGFYLLPGADQGALRFEREGTGTDAIDFGVLHGSVAVPARGQTTWTGRVYAGENHVASLAAVDPTLERVVDLGWFAMFGKPLVWVLSLLHGVLGKWGLAIIGVTVLLKIVFFPLTWRAMKSGQAMQSMQPEMAKIRTKYADDPQELNRRTLELMSQHGANPLSGCWPMLVQAPVFIALYNVLLTNVEFYQEPFLYLRDLSTPDPYCILPVLVTALMWGQQRITPTPENIDPAQQAVLKWMPILFGLFFFTSPSGLAIYVFVNVLLSIGQQWLIKRSLGQGPTAGAGSVPAQAGR